MLKQKKPGFPGKKEETQKFEGGAVAVSVDDQVEANEAALKKAKIEEAKRAALEAAEARKRAAEERQRQERRAAQRTGCCGCCR